MKLLLRSYFCFLVLLCSLFLIKPGSGCAQGFEDTNHAYWYQPNAAVKPQLLLWQSAPDSLGVMAVINQNNSQNRDAYSLSLHLRRQQDASTALRSPLNLRSPSHTTENQQVFTAKIPDVDSLYYLLLEVKSQNADSLAMPASYWATAFLHPELSFPPPPFYLSRQEEGLPFVQTFIPAGESLRLTGKPARYTVFQYRQEFEPAAPPMAPPGSTSSSLEVDSTFSLSGDSLFQLTEEGLYFFQHDTSSLKGLGLRVTNRYYPEVGTLQDFAGPIRYLSTNEEWRQLKNAGFSKKEVDSFWLKIAQNQEQAKRIIKTYYRQVAEANKLFTNYKEGWKTDQGMIYILYGAPDQVLVQGAEEEWIYRKTALNPEIKFTFVRVKNPFTNRHFVLVRSRNYTKSHYQTVSQWRRGRKTL